MGVSYPFSFKNKSIGGKIFRFNMFRAVWVLISGVKTPERGWNPVIPAMNCRAKHNPALKRRGGNLHPSTVIYRRLCLARHFSAGSGRLPSARGFNPMHSPAIHCRVRDATIGLGF